MKLRVDFYLLPTSTTEEAFRYACRLAEKSYLSEQKTFLWMASEEDALRINDILWTFKDISFIPHALYEGNENAVEPVLIGFKQAPSSGDVFINLTEHIPQVSAQFKRIIELVSDQPALIANSRKKYRLYQKNESEIFSHDLKKQPA
jgi:DNA polymerase-3 subunit chi